MSVVTFPRGLLAAGALWILALHPVLARVALPFWALGPLDFSAHLLTAALVLANVPRRLPRAFVLATLAASFLIDLDHAPQYAGIDALTAHTGRPYTHSLTTIVAALALAALLRAHRRGRLVALGVAAGVAIHLLRDVATGTIPLLWPVSYVNVQVPWWPEAALVAALAVAAWTRAHDLPHAGPRLRL